MQENPNIGWKKKHHRDVCAAKEAGFAKYEGQPGRIETACTNTPQLGSRYSAVHTPTAYTAVADDSNSHTKEHDMDQVAFVLGKKVTRQNTFYKVHSLNIQ